VLVFLRVLFWPILLLAIAAGTTVVNARIWIDVWEWFMVDPVDRSIFVASALFVLSIFKRTCRFSYAQWRSRTLVSMKVVLPRSDTKLDQEKRTEKDFKEKIASMEQLYRALWEVRNLDFWQTLHFWITRDIRVSFEMYVEKGQLTFFVVTHPKLVSIVEKQITAFYPDAEVSLEKTPEVQPKGYRLVGYYLKFQRGFMYPLRTYDLMQDDPLNGLANVLSKMERDEVAAIQIVLTPAIRKKWNANAKRAASSGFKGRKHSTFASIPILGFLLSGFSEFATGKKTNAPGASGGDSFVRMVQPEEDLYKRMAEKAGMSFYHTSIRIMASSKVPQRALELTNNIQVAFNAFKDLYGNVLVNKRMILPFLPHIFNGPIIRQLWKNRTNCYGHPDCMLVEKELAGLFHFPDSRYNKIPIIQWIGYRVLPPPPDITTEGVLLGYNRYRAVETPIHFKGSDRTRHQYIIGKSGCGKSSLVSWMSRQDIKNGDGLCIVDPHGDLIEDALAHTPKERAKDIIVFDPADNDRPMGLNLLEAKTPEEKDRASLDAMEIFIKLFGNEIFGPRIQHYFRNGCLTLMDDEEEGATLIDVPRMFVDEEFQKYKVAKCKNVVVRSFWEHEIAKTGAREKEEMIPYFSSKFGPFITNTTMRNIIGQPKSAFNIREIMDTGKVLLVNLSKGKIGDMNAQLLGLIFVNKVNMAAMSRADTPRPQRRRFYLYVDEFQNFVTDAFATILSEARKYELGLIMAHQYIGQLTGKTESYGQANSKMRDAVFGNVGSIMSFKIGAEDAEYMAKEMAPVVSDQDVIGIPNFSCYCKLNINNVTSRAFSMQTIYDESERNEKLAALIKEYSRMKYGRKKVFVNQEIEDRIGIVR
jgi:hypothetical protein